MLRRGLVHLVLHLEHDGDDLHTVLIGFPIDIVAFTSGPGVVVFLEIRILESRRAELVELDLAVLLERLTDHLRGHFRLQIFIVCDLLIFLIQKEFSRILFLYQCFFQIVLLIGQLRLEVPLLIREFRLKISLLCLDLIHCFHHGNGLLIFKRVQLALKCRGFFFCFSYLCLELLDLLVMLFLHTQANLALTCFDIGFVDLTEVFFHLIYTGIHILLELFVPDLLYDRVHFCIIYRESLSAMRTSKFSHEKPPYSVIIEAA